LALVNKTLIFLKLKDMKIVKRVEVWIHTHFVTDSKGMDLKTREKIKLEMEGFLRGIGIVFGIHFKENDEFRIVLECIPEPRKMELIHRKLAELLEPIKPKALTKRIITEEKKNGEDKGIGQSNP
jgi:hypothetical protein